MPEDYTERLKPEIIAEIVVANSVYVKYKRGKKVWEEFIPYARPEEFDTETSA